MIIFSIWLIRTLAIEYIYKQKYQITEVIPTDKHKLPYPLTYHHDACGAFSASPESKYLNFNANYYVSRRGTWLSFVSTHEIMFICYFYDDCYLIVVPQESPFKSAVTPVSRRKNSKRSSSDAESVFVKKTLREDLEVKAWSYYLNLG